MRRKKTEQEEKISLRERVADSFETSKEIVLDAARIIFIGNREVTIENYKGIVEYTAEKLVIETNPNRIKIEGGGLEVKTITADMLYITGKIYKTEFVSGGA